MEKELKELFELMQEDVANSHTLSDSYYEHLLNIYNKHYENNNRWGNKTNN